MFLGKHFPYGCAYYPEHWDRKLWTRDAQLMQKAGFNIVRVAEFAWYYFEPKEGQFDFAWLDDALDILARHGIRAILGTPTATIPAWMAKKYPHLMAIHDGLRRRPFGIRKDYCILQPDFIRLAARVTEQIARHYARDPRIAAFQLDNEFSSHRCRCNFCQDQFRAFLRRKYKTIDRLNHEYGTCFWGAVYNNFDEIDFPATDFPNPGHGLDLRRWASQVDIDHAALQARILRQHAPKIPITSNLMGLFSGIDYFEMAKSLDFVGWDTYPGPDTANRFAGDALSAAAMWAMKRKNYVVLEQQSGPGGWCNTAPQTAPGETAMLAWQSIARGADGILYFRWRTCTSGQEQYWNGILSHDNVPRRRYHEIATLGTQIKKLAPIILGTAPAADVGLYYNYDQIWATDYDTQCGHNPAKFSAILREMAGALASLGIDFALAGDGQPLSSYKLFLCPILYLTDPKLVAALTRYVRAGGHLVLTARSGAKTLNSKMVMDILPGAFAQLAGVEVEENSTLPADADWHVELPFGKIKANRIREHLIAKPGTQILGIHRGTYMDGLPAITRHNLGKGYVWYVGTLPTEADWQTLLRELILPAARISFRTDLPQGLEIARRQGKGRSLTFYLNHAGHAQSLTLPKSAKNLLTGKPTGPTLHLAPYEVAILESKP